MTDLPRRKLIMLPGPTNVPERVTAAMLRPTINHRGPEFKLLLKSMVAKMQRVLETSSDVVLLSASGTGAVETAVKNIVRKDDDIVVPVFGEFGGRLADQAADEGGNVIRVASEMGTAPSPDLIEDAARKAKSLKAVMVVYNDTSPGTTYRWLKEAADIAKAHGAFFVADAVSIVGGDELPQDRWGIDMVVGASQKCLAAPAGVSFVSVSEGLKKYVSRNRPSSSYFSIPKYLEFGERGETPYTPAIPLFFAFDEALGMVLEEGMERRVARHRATASALYSALGAGGLDPFVEPAVRSNVVVTARYPEGVDDHAFRSAAEEKFNVVMAGGFGQLKGKILRIGNMGEVQGHHVLSTVSAVGNALNMLGRRVDVGGMLAAAEEKLAALAGGR